MSNPILSVVIPCFDEGHYLIEAVQSVLQQEAGSSRALPKFEILVVNDNSKDEETMHALEQIHQMDGRVRVIRNSGRPGSSGARNTGIKAATGEWIAFLDGDDIWLKNAVDMRWRVLDNHPKAEWISADFRHFHEDEGRELMENAFFRSRPKPAAMLRKAFEGGETLRLRKPISQFLESVLAWTGTVMVKRSLLLHLGGFDESLLRAQDFHLWLRLANETDFFFTPHLIAGYRQRESTVANRGNPPGHWEILALEQLFNDPTFKGHRAAIRKRIVVRFQEDLSFYRAHGELVKGLRAFRRSLFYDPFRWPTWKEGVALLIGRR